MHEKPSPGHRWTTLFGVAALLGLLSFFGIPNVAPAQGGWRSTGDKNLTSPCILLGCPGDREVCCMPFPDQLE